MKILFVKTSALGDIVHTLPLLSFVRSYFPDASIDWVVERSFSQLISAHPFVDRTICIDTKKWRRALLSRSTWGEYKQTVAELKEREYDLLFDLQGNAKSALFTRSARAKVKVGFGRKSVAEWPNLLVTDRKYNPPKGKTIRSDYRFLVESYFSSAGFSIQKPEGAPPLLELSEDAREPIASPKNLKRVLVCPGSAWKNKQMTTEALALFLEKVQAHVPCTLLFSWGSTAEKQIVDSLHRSFPSSTLVGTLPLPSLQHLMNGLDLVIAMDSLPLHLAMTTEVPTFAVFGPSSAEKYGKEASRHGCYQGSCPYGYLFEKRCPKLRTCKTGYCIRGLTGSEVYQRFRQWWDSTVLPL